MTSIADVVTNFIAIGMFLLIAGCAVWLVTHWIRSYLRRFH